MRKQFAYKALRSAAIASAVAAAAMTGATAQAKDTIKVGVVSFLDRPCGWSVRRSWQEWR